MKKFTFLMSVAFAMLLSSSVLAQDTLFYENFEDGNAASKFTKVEKGSSNVADLAHAYGAQTPAPNGGKKCMKIQVNTSAGEPSFVGLYPKELNLKGNYTLTFNAWFNWTSSSTSTTEFLYYGVGHSNTTAGPPSDGMDFAFTGDNGSSRDRRLYKDGAEVQDVSLYSGGTQNQGAFQNNCLKPVAVGPGDIAKPGLQWLKVTAQVSDSGVYYMVGNVTMKDTVWAHFDKDALPADGDVIIGYYDMFSSVSTDDVYLLVDNILVTKPSTTGIDKHRVEDLVTIYPNPVNDVLHVTVKRPATFELYNIEGQLVKKQQVERTAAINVSDVTKGLYIVRVTDKEGYIQTKKLVVR
jgi:hypothetical protein